MANPIKTYLEVTILMRQPYFDFPRRSIEEINITTYNINLEGLLNNKKIKKFDLTTKAWTLNYNKYTK